MTVSEQCLRHDWKAYTLTNDNGMTVRLMNYGGIIREIIVPDKHGKMENIVLGYEYDTDYETNPNFFGALIGRVAGRIANASFSIDGETYKLEQNEGKHHLHGGSSGFHSVIWKAESFETDQASGVRLEHTSTDGTGGYPGNVHAVVTYTLSKKHNKLELNYHATTDKTTALTLTNHAYFNLSGNLKRTVGDHQVTFAADHAAELDQNLIPTGQQFATQDTNFDFGSGRFLRGGFTSATAQNNIAGCGYDHYFMWEQQPGKVHVREPGSGRLLRIETTQPGMVMYTGNGLPDGSPLQEGSSVKHLGVCFETQSFPASLHHHGFPEIMLHPEETYDHHTIYQFEVEENS